MDSMDTKWPPKTCTPPAVSGNYIFLSAREPGLMYVIKEALYYTDSVCETVLGTAAASVFPLV